MKPQHYLLTALLVIGLLFVYHVVIQQRQGVKGLLSGIGIGK
jgi:hypothetical protein